VIAYRACGLFRGDRRGRRTIKRKQVIKPSRLRHGDLIGVISPAGPVDESKLQPGLEIMRSSGYRVRLAPHIYDKRDYLAGQDEVRLEDLHTMFQDPEIKAIFCARGVYGSLRLLDKIHYGLIRKNPKIFVGYSDVTALLLAIHLKTGLVTFHGPMVRDLASNQASSWNSLVRLLSSGKPLQLGLQGSALIAGKARGPLVGGNLSLICHLVGTPFLPSLEGCILFVEEKAESLYRLDRMMTHLGLSGQLKGISGLIAGEFVDCGETAAIHKLLADIVSDLDIPLASGLQAGHGPRNLAVPIGLMAEIDTSHMTLSIAEACTKG
jgi:muramoyltetrapeptide carboxypeptidase